VHLRRTASARREGVCQNRDTPARHGAGQGLAFAPLTGFGIRGATADDAGAASGVVNTFHQVGSSLGLGVLVAISAGAAEADGTASGIADEVSAALLAASGFLLAALIVVLALIAPQAAAEHRSRRVRAPGLEEALES
jgi:hypothetical protein